MSVLELQKVYTRIFTDGDPFEPYCTSRAIVFDFSVNPNQGSRDIDAAILDCFLEPARALLVDFHQEVTLTQLAEQLQSSDGVIIPSPLTSLLLRGTLGSRRSADGRLELSENEMDLLVEFLPSVPLVVTETLLELGDTKRLADQISSFAEYDYYRASFAPLLGERPFHQEFGVWWAIYHSLEGLSVLDLLAKAQAAGELGFTEDQMQMMFRGVTSAIADVSSKYFYFDTGMFETQIMGLGPIFIAPLLDALSGGVVSDDVRRDCYRDIAGVCDGAGWNETCAYIARLMTLPSSEERSDRLTCSLDLLAFSAELQSEKSFNNFQLNFSDSRFLDVFELLRLVQRGEIDATFRSQVERVLSNVFWCLTAEASDDRLDSFLRASGQIIQEYPALRQQVNEKVHLLIIPKRLSKLSSYREYK